ncbi:MAG TPA: dienelactone hydrolase family protein [Methylomirabilota bacterium]|nr:dienelactone hydrolase family protein [Methylomirabilota bacterium]
MRKTAPEPLQSRSIQIPVGGVKLDGELVTPGECDRLVIFAHGSGSSRLSPRNRYVASILHEANLGTLLFDLLTPAEEHDEYFTRHLRFDISFLAQRLIAATSWLRSEQRCGTDSLGYFGASTGAAAALVAAAEYGDRIRAVVSRGGRPDLAEEHLPKVKSPTLLIVGGDDFGVMDLNRDAYAAIGAHCEFATIAGATHLFTEAGALEQVALLAQDWFNKHL